MSEIGNFCDCRFGNLPQAMRIQILHATSGLDSALCLTSYGRVFWLVPYPLTEKAGIIIWVSQSAEIAAQYA